MAVIFISIYFFSPETVHYSLKEMFLCKYIDIDCLTTKHFCITHQTKAIVSTILFLGCCQLLATQSDNNGSQFFILESHLIAYKSISILSSIFCCFVKLKELERLI